MFLQLTAQYLISMPGGSEWIFIVLAIVIFFGGKKIPELAKGLGKGMREFKEAREGSDTSEKNQPAPTEDKVTTQAKITS